MTPPLVCPACRAQDGTGRLRVTVLEDAAAPSLLRCPTCRTSFPVVDGVPIVVRDLAAWLEHERPAVLARRDLPPHVLSVLAAGAPVLSRDAALQATYERPQGDLPGLVRDLARDLDAPLLDLGCGRGLHDRTDAVGLDLSFAMARSFVGKGVVGDAADPPFLAHAFRSVLALNLLDSCRDPRAALGQADALLPRGGRLVVSCAYAWDDAVTPRRARFEPADLLAALAGEPSPLDLDLEYRLCRVEDGVTWRLSASSRHAHEYRCQVVVAEKLGDV